MSASACIMKEELKLSPFRFPARRSFIFLSASVQRDSN